MYPFFYWIKDACRIISYPSFFPYLFCYYYVSAWHVAFVVGTISEKNIKTSMYLVFIFLQVFLLSIQMPVGKGRNMFLPPSSLLWLVSRFGGSGRSWRTSKGSRGTPPRGCGVSERILRKDRCQGCSTTQGASRMNHSVDPRESLGQIWLWSIFPVQDFRGCYRWVRAMPTNPWPIEYHILGQRSSVWGGVPIQSVAFVDLPTYLRFDTRIP